MVWQDTWEDPFAAYVDHFRPLIGDRRTWRTFREVLKGIVAAGSLICQKIAAASPLLSQAEDGGQRVIRLATGESTRRSALNAESLTERLRQHGIAQLAEADTDDLWLNPGPFRVAQAAGPGDAGLDASA